MGQVPSTWADSRASVPLADFLTHTSVPSLLRVVSPRASRVEVVDSSRALPSVRSSDSSSVMVRVDRSTRSTS